MANRFARKAGNHNDVDVWSDTPSGTAAAEFIPGAGDIAYSNNFDITIIANWTVQQIRNDANGSGATAGKGFFLTDGVTLTGNVSIGADGTAPNEYGLRLNSGSATIVGNVINNWNTWSKFACINSGSGTLTIIGDVLSNPASANYTLRGVTTSGSGNLVVQGTVYGGSVSTGNSHGIYHASSGQVVADNVVGGSVTTVESGNAAGIRVFGIGSVEVVGTVTAGSNTGGIFSDSVGDINVGNVLCSSNSPGVIARVGRVFVRKPIRRRLVVDGGDPTIFPVLARRLELTGPPADRYIEMLDPDDSTVTAYRESIDAVIVDADLLARLRKCSTVEITGAQIGALNE
jgi:hypothetical protein